MLNILHQVITSTFASRSGASRKSQWKERRDRFVPAIESLEHRVIPAQVYAYNGDLWIKGGKSFDIVSVYRKLDNVGKITYE